MARQGWGRHSTVATGSDSGDQVSVNAWNADTNKAGMLGFTGQTLASATSVTPTSSTLILSGSTNVSTITITETAEYDLLYVFTSGTVTLVNTSSPSSAGDIKLLANVDKDLSTTVPTILIRKGNFWIEYGGGITNALNDIGDVVITSVANEDVLAYDSTTSKWINQSADETGRVTASSTTTFTNKTIDQDGTGNSITNIADASIKASAAIAQSKIANLTTDLSGKSPTAGNTSLVTTGALDTGSITSGFGNINIGSSTFTTSGAVTTGAITAPSISGSSGSTTGNAATATALATARTIGGTSFDGTANIAVALSATSTALATARTIGGVSFDGTANIDLPGVNTAGNQNTSGTAATVTGAAQTAITSVGTLTGLTVDNVNIDARKIQSNDSNGNLELYAKGSGVVKILGDAGSNDGAITLNCRDNSHGQKIQSQPHSASASNTLLLPVTSGNAQSTLVSEISTQTLTNKTLTSPVVNVGSDATGDIYYRNSSGVFTRLAKPGSPAGEVLTFASGATIPSWTAPAGGGATVTHDYTIQASSYTGGNATGTTRSVFIRTIDTNNEGVFVKIKKNGTADTEVQIA